MFSVPGHCQSALLGSAVDLDNLNSKPFKNPYLQGLRRWHLGAELGDSFRAEERVSDSMVVQL